MDYWTKLGETHLLGKKIAQVRYMSETEAENLNWKFRPIVIQLNDGTLIFPSRDDEGNDAGALFGSTPNGEDLTFPVVS